MKFFLLTLLLTFSSCLLSMRTWEERKEIRQARTLPDEEFCIRAKNKTIIFIDPTKGAHADKLIQLIEDISPLLTRIRVVDKSQFDQLLTTHKISLPKGGCLQGPFENKDAKRIAKKSAKAEYKESIKKTMAALKAAEVRKLYISNKDLDNLFPSWVNKPDIIEYLESCNTCHRSYLGKLLCH